jgi:hypothetical protein
LALIGNDLRVVHDHGRRSDLVVRRSREQKMTDPAAIAAIIDQYVKHGWKLRRVLMSRNLIEALGSSEIFAGADVRPSQYDGMWFSRRSLPDREAWELRRISAAPFAVVEVIPDEFTDQERDEVLSEAEDRMFDAARTKETSH